MCFTLLWKCSRITDAAPLRRHATRPVVTVVSGFCCCVFFVCFVLFLPLKGARFVSFPTRYFSDHRVPGSRRARATFLGTRQSCRGCGSLQWVFCATPCSLTWHLERESDSAQNVVDSDDDVSIPTRCPSVRLSVCRSSCRCSLDSGSLFSLIHLLLLLSGEVTPLSWQIYVILWPVRGSTYDVWRLYCAAKARSVSNPGH